VPTSHTLSVAASDDKETVRALGDARRLDSNAAELADRLAAVLASVKQVDEVGVLGGSSAGHLVVAGREELAGHAFRARRPGDLHGVAVAFADLNRPDDLQLARRVVEHNGVIATREHVAAPAAGRHGVDAPDPVRVRGSLRQEPPFVRLPSTFFRSSPWAFRDVPKHDLVRDCARNEQPLTVVGGGYEGERHAPVGMLFPDGVGRESVERVVERGVGIFGEVVRTGVQLAPIVRHNYMVGEK
jgi:hypothetical protein